MKSRLKTIADKTFKDKTGHIVLAQWPNIPLAGWIVLELATSIAHQTRIVSGLHNSADAFLAIWAYLEIRHGVNYFRIGLGTITAIVIILGFFKM